MRLQAKLNGHHYQFRDVKDVLAKANEEKSGDFLAGLAAGSAGEEQPDRATSAATDTANVVRRFIGRGVSASS